MDNEIFTIDLHEDLNDVKGGLGGNGYGQIGSLWIGITIFDIIKRNVQLITLRVPGQLDITLYVLGQGIPVHALVAGKIARQVL